MCSWTFGAEIVNFFTEAKADKSDKGILEISAVILDILELQNYCS